MPWTNSGLCDGHFPCSHAEKRSKRRFLLIYGEISTGIAREAAWLRPAAAVNRLSTAGLMAWTHHYFRPKRPVSAMRHPWPAPSGTAHCPGNPRGTAHAAQTRPIRSPLYSPLLAPKCRFGPVRKAIYLVLQCSANLAIDALRTNVIYYVPFSAPTLARVVKLADTHA